MNDKESATIAAPDGNKKEIIELLSSDDDDDNGDNNDARPPAVTKPRPPAQEHKDNSKPPAAARYKIRNRRGRTKQVKNSSESLTRLPLQAGLVLEEDVDECVQNNEKSRQVRSPNAASAQMQESSEDEDNPNPTGWTLASYTKYQEEQKQQGKPIELFHDLEFESTPSSIEGQTRQNKVEKCRCTAAQGSAQPVALSYITRGPNKGRPYHHCPKPIPATRCKYFRWAFQAERMHWYRFGSHTGHVLVRDQGFSADDLLQGRVGDCWFLS